MLQRVAFVALAICAAQTLFAQSEAALWEALEGRTVTAKVDLPAAKSGIDINPDASPAANDLQFGKELKQFGTAVRRKEPVTITDLKVSPKSIAIELQPSDSATESASQVYVAAAKSRQERNLERDLENETDPARRERMQKDLDELRAKRLREDERLKAALAQLTRAGQNSNRNRGVAEARFNLVFPSGVPSRALRPDYVMAALKPWIDFESSQKADSSDAADQSAQPPAEQATSAEVSSAPQVHKGMTEAELKHLLGDPVKRQPSEEGDLHLHVEILTFKRDDATLEATMVEGVLVRFREWSD